MKRSLLVMGILIAIVYACNQKNPIANHLLNPGKLASQFFVVNTQKDTALVTQKGALIRIPQGALQSASATVKLEVKEAYSMKDIIKAGLTTETNGQPLSSGGMIYINAVSDEEVKIIKNISIATPSPMLDSNMKLFKGEVKDDSTINWKDPQPLPPNPQLAALAQGNQFFYENCASCHALDKDLTGPALGHYMKTTFPYVYGNTKNGRDHLYEFIRNPEKTMAHSGYYQCQKIQYGGAMMTAFPALTDKDLDYLFAWIENESERLGLPVLPNKLLQCRDSCQLYTEVATHWNEIKNSLEKEKVEMVNEERNFDTVPLGDIDTTDFPFLTPADTTFLNKVSPMENESLYYQFDIDAFGWYNLDRLAEGVDGVEKSELTVKMKGPYKKGFNLYLIIPSVKAFVEGGPLKDEENKYGFHLNNGTLPLPQQAPAYIIALGEYEDKLLFAKQVFQTQKSQSFDLELKIITQAEFDQQIRAMNLDNLQFKVSETRNAVELREVVKEVKKAEELKPKNCNCDCFIDSDTPR